VAVQVVTWEGICASIIPVGEEALCDRRQSGGGLKSQHSMQESQEGSVAGNRARRCSCGVEFCRSTYTVAR